jgi:hypothetical protein
MFIVRKQDISQANSLVRYLVLKEVFPFSKSQ